ncbi:hypothetical protein STCU_03591 [Strigomonas culicis]|uniref:Uncharacterized protein n=1 Tax=Strigomonas culicis TaxID=28005 RepID=S9UQX9_9TRYP|nr:hypothetical protein STCU_03591 [Strigomonas culicis]|eukprot:EPY31164.1 hypothetical protein STCU_03591 [Strigomonas culicis]
MLVSRKLHQKLFSVPAHGQDSIRKLVYAPFAFLGGGDLHTLSSTLASAICFLEGYSMDDMDTKLEFEEGDKGQIVAHSQLTMVPYKAEIPFERNKVDIHQSILKLKKQKHVNVELEHKITLQKIQPDPMLDLAPTTHYTRDVSNSFNVEHDLNDALLKTTSLRSIRNMLSLSAQSGIILPRETLVSVLQRVGEKDEGLVSFISTNFDYEYDLEAILSNRHTFNTPIVERSLKRRKSRLELSREKKR